MQGLLCKDATVRIIDGPIDAGGVGIDAKSFPDKTAIKLKGKE